ncbi:MAG: hypothetical protein U5R31_17705 [Acidimicrobiia bacterium]|nr:hypothetical protein [Acidimicrobiia bacterium]
MYVLDETPDDALRRAARGGRSRCRAGHRHSKTSSEVDKTGASVREQHTSCRICEAMCGLVVTVEDDKIVDVHPDDQAMSEGSVCTKASAMVEVTYDRDRVLHPLKRIGGPGEFGASPGTKRSTTSPKSIRVPVTSCHSRVPVRFADATAFRSP